jgi:hypothetical protein
MSYEELAYAVKNSVSAGLKSPANYSYSIEQIIDESLLLRAKIIAEQSMSYKINSKYFMQKLTNVTLSCEKLNGACSVPIDEVEAHFKMPKPLSTPGDDIMDIGPIDNTTSFKIYYDTNYSYHGYRYKTAHKPFVFIDLAAQDDEGYVRAYLMNAGKYKELKYLNVRGIFADPRLASPAPNFYMEEFHAPFEVQSTIIDMITAKYVQYYRQLNYGPVPNTQTSPVT